MLKLPAKENNPSGGTILSRGHLLNDTLMPHHDVFRSGDTYSQALANELDLCLSLPSSTQHPLSPRHKASNAEPDYALST